jgi:hypothetical protein
MTRMANPADRISVNATARGVWKREIPRARPRSKAYPIKRRRGKGSRVQPTEPLKPMSRATTIASEASAIGLGRLFRV